MFGKVTLLITGFLIIMFIGLFYYQSGVNPPHECIELQKDYAELSKLVESDEYKEIAQQVLSSSKIQSIHNLNQHYKTLLNKQFRRNGFEEFKQSCINAKKSLNIDGIIESFKQHKKSIYVYIHKHTQAGNFS